MKKENKSRYAVLGMLFDNPRSGYEIRELMKESVKHFWQETDSSIYPMLKKLEAEGKVKSTSKYRGKQVRKIFKITSDGKKEFISWMHLPAQTDLRRNELLLKIFFGSAVSHDEIIKHLKNQLHKFQEIRQKLEWNGNKLLALDDQNPQKLFWVITINQGKAHVDAEIQWINQSIKLLEKTQS